MNTRFTYMYRDSGNYKFYRTIVLSGVLDAVELQNCLNEKDYFIPSVVGLEDLQPNPFTIDDHIWHEVSEISSTSDQPTMELSSADLAVGFGIAKKMNWQEMEVISRKFGL